MTLIQVVTHIIKQVEIIVIAAVKAVKRGIIISNFPKSQTVKGSITVANQKNLEKKLDELKKTVKTLVLPESVKDNAVQKTEALKRALANVEMAIRTNKHKPQKTNKTPKTKTHKKTKPKKYI